MRRCIFIDSRSAERDTLIFDIAEKNYREGEKTLIVTDTEDRANEIDRFLWVFRQESFIPHKIFAYGESEPLETIGIVYRDLNPIMAQTVIVDGASRFDLISTFSRIYDFVDYRSEKLLHESRARFKQYKTMGFAMEHNKL